MNRSFLEQCKSKLQNIGHIKPHGTIYTWGMSSMKDNKIFKEYLYKNVNLSFSLKRKQKIFDSDKARYSHNITSWTDKKIKDEYLIYIKRLGRIPNQKEIKTNLLGAIYTHGYTLTSLAEYFGYKPTKEFWNKKKIIIQLCRLTNKLNKFPTHPEMGGALSSAVSKHGGSTYFKQFITIN